MTVKNETCEIEVTFNPRRMRMAANVYYGAKLISGEWPSDTDLVVACDNGKFGQPNRTFGGTVSAMSDKEKYVTVYVD